MLLVCSAFVPKTGMGLLKTLGIILIVMFLFSFLFLVKFYFSLQLNARGYQSSENLMDCDESVANILEIVLTVHITVKTVINFILKMLF